MPIYEYSCEKCGAIVERIQKVTDPAPKKHEGCGGRLSKVMSRSSFQLKGGGWYKDLYSSTPAKTSESKSSSSDSKGGSKGGSADSSSEKKSAPAEAKSPAKESKPVASSEKKKPKSD